MSRENLLPNGQSTDGIISESMSLHDIVQVDRLQRILYGEFHFWADVRDVFMKQKHRMLWEREHGPIGAQQASPKDGDKEADSAISVLRKYYGHVNIPKELKV
ncbi:unnamed protein product [Schistocephalus solidus]|uniref:Clr5 domain-containing protein n=1 Tax=Schistocephalus solidus TaxID=70667 RepID=A0A183TTP9_SCHSO|nr:unnamed protein product [Schistocephalus solidus]